MSIRNPSTPSTTGLPLSSTFLSELSDPNVPFGLSGFTNNIYGVPWIIGAKKGFPNFNGLEVAELLFH